jgi:hypothetical protein
VLTLASRRPMGPRSASTATGRPGNDAGDPYWGGLQMDRGFMRAYGGDMIARHHGAGPTLSETE